MRTKRNVLADDSAISTLLRILAPVISALLFVNLYQPSVTLDMRVLKLFLAFGIQLSLTCLSWLPAQAVAHRDASHVHVANTNHLYRRGNTEAHRREHARRRAEYEQGKQEWQAARAEYLRDPEAYLRKVGGSGGVPGTPGTRALPEKHTGADECPVCLEALQNEGGLVRAVGPCGHRLHHQCAFQWEETRAGADKRPTCPSCRGRMWYDGATGSHQKALGLQSHWPEYMPRQTGAGRAPSGPELPSFARPPQEATPAEMERALQAIHERKRAERRKKQGAGEERPLHHAMDEARGRVEHLEHMDMDRGDFHPHPLKARAARAPLRKRGAKLPRN